MKKIIALILSGTFALSLTACGKPKLVDRYEVPISESEASENGENLESVPTSENSEDASLNVPVVIETEDELAAAKLYLSENFCDFDLYNNPKSKIDGSTSMSPLREALRNLFNNKDDFYLSFHSKTADAFELFLDRGVQVLFSVDYSEEYLDKAEKRSVAVVKKPITREAFVFLINKENPVKDLTTEQIKKIYSGEITNWKEVGGDDAQIHAFQRNADSGSQMRMEMFMGEVPLMEVERGYYMEGMGQIMEEIAKYDSGKYAIAYNMYTFTDKQYNLKEVEMLAVDGVKPTDDTIYDNSYPIVIYNYIYYDNNRASSVEFGENLYTYLTSEEGRELIANAGYVNLNKGYDRNMEVRPPNTGEDNIDYGGNWFEGDDDKFYDVDGNGGLLVYDNYADYVFRDVEYNGISAYADNAKARAFVELIRSANARGWDKDGFHLNDDGLIQLSAYHDASLDHEDFFTYVYNNVYYDCFAFRYDVKNDKYILKNSFGEDTYNSYSDINYYSGSKMYSKYFADYKLYNYVELTKSDLKDLYLLKPWGEGQAVYKINGVVVENWTSEDEGLEVEFGYYQPFAGILS